MQLTVNGTTHEVAPSDGERLLETLTEKLHLTGTKFGCGHGECGACTVLIDGRLAYSCITLSHACEGKQVTTVEGLATGETLSALQRAFIAHDAAQCGYCTPGQLVAATHLLAGQANPSEAQIREGMSGNLCRCGTYPKIISAIQAVARGEFGEASAP
jgi:xanthine dehydrogenase YagT iron-sulfur-binding subunit